MIIYISLIENTAQLEYSPLENPFSTPALNEQAGIGL